MGWLGNIFAFGRRKLSRQEYKKVWNALSATEDDAKRAVSGYTDEGAYQHAGKQTYDMLRASVGVNADDVILEIGAGVGRVGAVLAPICKEWIGVDVSENMVQHMQRRLRGYRNVRAIATSGFDLAPIASSSVDMAYCTVVFMHLDEWERYSYVAEAFRVLKPGGRFVVDNVNLLGDDGWAMFESHRATPPRKRVPHLSKTSTPEELHAYFSRAGFSDITQVAGSLWVVTFGRKPRS